MFAPPVWAASIGQALAASAATERGLSSVEAAARLRALGPNELAPPRRFEGVRELLRYFANPLVLILLVAWVGAAVGGALTLKILIRQDHVLENRSLAFKA